MDVDSRDGLAACGYLYPLRDGDGVRTDDDGNIHPGVARIEQMDSGEPVVGLLRAGEEAFDGKIGQPAIGVDPIGEEPVQVGLGGLLERGFEICSGLWGAAQSSGERVVACDVAEHPEDIGRLGAVVGGRGGGAEWLAGTLTGAFRLDEREG